MYEIQINIYEQSITFFYLFNSILKTCGLQFFKPKTISNQKVLTDKDKNLRRKSRLYNAAKCHCGPVPSKFWDQKV